MLCQRDGTDRYEGTPTFFGYLMISCDIMAQTNHEIAGIFQQMAEVLEILGSNRFRVLAFQKAGRVLRDLTTDLADIHREDLARLDGIGKGMVDRISEFVETGTIADHQELMDQIPTGLVQLLDVPGLGPKTIAVLWKQGGITDLQNLKAKIDSDELARLPGFGKKKLENIKRDLAFAADAGKRVRLGEALPLARWFVEQLGALPSVNQVAFAGSVRRGQETIGDLDIVVSAVSEAAPSISDVFVKLKPSSEVIAQGPTKTSIRTGQGIQVDLRIVPPESFGAALMYFTGNKAHNVAMRERAIAGGLKLNEYGLGRQGSGQHVAGKTEQQVFKALGLAWIPPELREDHGEIGQAESNKCPDLLEIGDIRAELHAHTTASDGQWTIEELATAAANRGFHTVAVTDHSKGQAQAHGLTVQQLERHIETIRAVASKLETKIQVLAGSEVDILADGQLDYPDSLLKDLDVVVASPHSALSQNTATCTKRFLRAIENPYVTIIGHLTGRIINRREGLSPDIAQLIGAAADRGIAFEINANSYRLDLRDIHARAAIEAGVQLSINTDAHGPGDLDQLMYGVLTARRAGVTRVDVINCMSKTTLAKWLKSTRS